MFTSVYYASRIHNSNARASGPSSLLPSAQEGCLITFACGWPWIIHCYQACHLKKHAEENGEKAREGYKQIAQVLGFDVYSLLFCLVLCCLTLVLFFEDYYKQSWFLRPCLCCTLLWLSLRSWLSPVRLRLVWRMLV